MKNIIVSLLCLITGCSALSCASGTMLPESVEIYQNTTDSSEHIPYYFDSVAVLVDGSQNPPAIYCSGVFIGNNIYTAAHCVDDRTSVQVGVRQAMNIETATFNRLFLYERTFINATNDVAILTPSEQIPPHVSSSIAQSNARYGERVISFGNPFGFVFFFSQGYVVAPTRLSANHMKYTLANFTVYPGMSGGPCFNQYGEVVGLNSFAWRYGAWSMVGLVHRTSLVSARNSVATR